MLKKIAYFNSGVTSANFTENEDGSISKRALVLAEGGWTDNKGRFHDFPAERIQRIAENTNSFFNDGIRIPVAKEHGKTIDDFVGDVNSPFVVKEITEDDLPNKRNKHLLGKLGIFCDDIVIRAKDTIEKVKNNLAKELSPGIDVVKDRIKEISIVGFPAIQGMSLFSEGKDMEGVFTLDDADAMSQDDEQLEEQFEDLSKKFYCVLKNIMKHEDELGENAQQMVEKAFADYDLRLRDLFGLSGEIPDEDETVGDVQRNGYSLQDAPGMVIPKTKRSEYAPYSLYASDDDAEFAFKVGDWFGKKVSGIGASLGTAKRYGKEMFKSARTKDWDAVKGIGKEYFTGRTPGNSRLNYKRTGLALAGVGAAGYGAYKLGRAGLGAVGIGRKENRY